MSRFPRFAEEIRKLYDELASEFHKQRQRPMRRDDVVGTEEGKLDVSAGAFSNYLSGVSAPEGGRIGAIAEFFASRLSHYSAQDLGAVLREAGEYDREAFQDPFHDEGRTRQRPLRIGIINYRALGTGAEAGSFVKRSDRGFLGWLATVWSASAGFPPGSAKEGDAPRALALDSLERDVCEPGGHDIGVGVFLTPDRIRRLRFLPTPIAIPINAVYSESIVHARGWGEDELSVIRGHLLRSRVQEDRAEDDSITEWVEPIATPMEVGGLHLQNVLERKFKKVAYDEKEFIAGLKTKRKKRVPLAVVDEVMCAEIVRKEMQDGDGDLQLLFDGSEGASTQLGRMPRFYVGLVINRQHEGFADFVEESLECFVQANVEFVAQEYVNAWRKLDRDFGMVFDTANSKAAGRPGIAHGPEAWMWPADDDLEASARFSRGPWRAVVRRASEIRGAKR